MSERRQAERPQPEHEAAEQAERCRRLSQATYDRATSEMLGRMADDFERRARFGSKD